MLLLIIGVYMFFGSAGLRGAWPTYMAYYDLLAEGFRAGHLHLVEEPPAELLAVLDPFNPRHGQWWMWDVSLYGGHYYLYWGPLPALLQALAKSLLGIHRIIGDQYLVCGFFALSTVFGGLLIERMARRLFPGVSALSIALAVLAFGFANPVPHLVATAGVYQAAIAGGQAGLMGGLLLAFNALFAGSERRRRWLLVGAGSLWALALASRISLILAIATIGALTLAVAAWPTTAGARDWRALARRGLAHALCLGTPLALMVALLLLYNYLRFDRWTEFGTGVQLTTMKFELSWRYWPVNAYSYALRAFHLSCQFPYVVQGAYQGPTALPSWLPPPPGYLITEPLVGYLCVVPCLWLTPVAAWAGVRALGQLRSGQQPAGQENVSKSGPISPDMLARVRLWCVGSFAVAGSLSGVMVMGLYIATMRYLADVTFGLLLLATFAAFTLESAARRRWQRRAAITLFALLTSASVGAGLLLGFQGYNDHFQRFNPRLAQKLTRAWSICP